MDAEIVALLNTISWQLVGINAFLGAIMGLLWGKK
jgi:hypothetical protein